MFEGIVTVLTDDRDVVYHPKPVCSSLTAGKQTLHTAIFHRRMFKACMSYYITTRSEMMVLIIVAINRRIVVFLWKLCVYTSVGGIS